VRQLTTLTSALLDPLMAADPGGSADHLLRRRHRRADRAVDGHPGQLGRQTGNLVRDEPGAGPSSRVAVLLPAHWQTAAVFGIWWIGAEVVLDGDADIALCTADRLPEADDAVGVGEIAVLSLDPFVRPIADLPVGVTDYATSVRVHPIRSRPNATRVRHWVAVR
jgi:uncharacterized protein (TIGR03089 family)